MRFLNNIFQLWTETEGRRTSGKEPSTAVSSTTTSVLKNNPEGLAGGRGHRGPKSAPEAPNEEDPIYEKILDCNKYKDASRDVCCIIENKTTLNSTQTQIYQLPLIIETFSITAAFPRDVL